MVRVGIVQLGASALLGLVLSGCGSGETSSTSSTTTSTPGSCSGPTVDLALKYFHVQSPEELVAAQLDRVQRLCANGSCPTVNVPGCSPQSLDDVQCEVPQVFNASVKLGAETVCGVVCSDQPCKLGCRSVGSAACYSADFVACKARCLGKEPCVQQCEESLVEPCKVYLVDACSNRCETTFETCNRDCNDQMTMDVSADLRRFSGAISSASFVALDVNCSGDAISAPLQFSGNVEVDFGGMSVDLLLHAFKGKSPAQSLSLTNIKLSVAVPLQGNAQCDLFGQGNVSTVVGEVMVTGIDFDLGSTADQLRAVSDAACADLASCRGGIRSSISNAISTAIGNIVNRALPAQLGRELKPLLQGMFDGATCAMFIPEGLNPIDHGNVTISV